MTRGRTSLEACDACLRRAELIGRLAPRITGLLRSPRSRQPGLLALPEEELVLAVAGEGAAEVRRWLRGLRLGDVRRRVSEAGLDCVCRHAAAYPPGLLELPDPPAALYLAGGRERLRALTRAPGATVVGGRAATPYALEVARALGRGLCAAGVTVVSGLALGADGAAHRGALQSGGEVLGVLASGADVPYPSAHRDLYRRVRAAGAVVSELPPGTRPLRWSFPARNRIMAALSRITVVVEARKSSGSLITARFAEDLGRTVGAVPGRVTSEHAAGSNRLLRDGAPVIRGARDVLDEIFGVGQGPTGANGSEASRRRALLATDTSAGASTELDPAVRRVLDAVGAGHGVDAIGREAGVAPGEARAALGRLELLGLVSRDGLGAYERTV